MMKLTSLATVSLLAVSALLLGGCDQAEKSAQQLMGKAAESAKLAIDETHKAAEQALNEATGGIIGKKEGSTDEDSERKEDSSQEI